MNSKINDPLMKELKEVNNSLYSTTKLSHVQHTNLRVHLEIRH